MKQIKKQKLIVAGAIVIATIILVVALGFKTKSVAADNTPTVTVTDLQQAGYTKPTVQSANNKVYAAPNLYFRVQEHVSISTGWGTAGNIVAVLIIPKRNLAWQYNKGQMKTMNIDGRTQIRFSTAKNYIVITGPNTNKVMALARSLANKF